MIGSRVCSDEQFHGVTMEWYDEAECTFPACKCNVPDYAYSQHNRKEFCDKWKQLIGY